MTKQPIQAAPASGAAPLRDLLDPLLSQTTINVGILERLASLAVGATVLLLIVRRFLLYGGLLIAGGYLLYRGLTGYCPLYASAAIDTRHWWLPWPVLAGNEKRSKFYEQDNLTRQMAARAWQPEDGVGALD